MTPIARLEKLARDKATLRVPEGLRRLPRISAVLGQDRDLVSIERFYIEELLQNSGTDIKGRCLEMGDPTYTHKFGGDAVTKAEVLNNVQGNPQATIVAYLTDAPHIPGNSFERIIIAQTLQMIFEVNKAIAAIYRIFKPGRVVSCTSLGMTCVARREGVGDWGEYGQFAAQSKRRLFHDVFPKVNAQVPTVGNFFNCICNLHGLAASVSSAELNTHDPNCEMLVLVRAQEPVT